MSNLVSVWDLDGNEHKMSLANATDMVNHNKWTTENPGVTVENVGDINKPMPEQFQRGFFAQKAKMVSVIDKEGVIHVMDNASAQDMVRHLGWRVAQTQSAVPAVVIAEPEEDLEPAQVTGANLTGEIVVKKRGRPAKVVEPDPVPDTDAELTNMTRDELAAYALKVLDLKFEDNVTHDEMLDTILREL